MANLLDQMIEQISREKHIEPGIIVAAIEDAMVVAARKYYKTEEDLRAKFNPETGQVDHGLHPLAETAAGEALSHHQRQAPPVECGQRQGVDHRQ